MSHQFLSAPALVKLCARSLFTCLLFPLVGLLLWQPVFADLVPRGAQWKYLDDGSGAQADWQLPTFDDSTWADGFGQLGYGDGDESTVISFGPDDKDKHITTYFRHEFDVLSVPTEPLTLRVQRDDGVIVYLNGVEIFRDNMRTGFVGPNTKSLSAVLGADEAKLHTTQIDPQLLVPGSNTIAAEVHIANRATVDLSFDLQLTTNPLVRGPYLQQSSEAGITVRWRTANARDAVLRYGTDRTNLNQIVSETTLSTEHLFALNGLDPNTRYYYSIGDSNGDYTSGDNYFFDTHPPKGSATPTRIWVLGDSGTADANAAAVSNAFTLFNNGHHSDVWLMLGDNAYDDGTDDEYQNAVFDMYPQVLRNTVLWPTLGNHDAFTADSDTQSGNYFDIFSLPTNGESGGVASGTEAYYSFDYGNIHFVSLDSHDTDRSADGAMATWLKDDLAANTQEWIIAFWHHPPYSKGSHDSDSEARLADMRTNFVPIFESYGVDLVLAGHSHSYERSMLIDGHHGTSDSFNSSQILDGGDGDPTGDGAYVKFAGSNSGSVYSVAGSSGKRSSAPLDHPIMISNLVELGSMVIDVQGNQLDAIFLDDNATVRDSFRIVHQSTTDVESVEIGSATLDYDKIIGPRWKRVNFSPLTTGLHTIRVDWSGDADIRYSLFRVNPGNANQRIDFINLDSPAEWTGQLDSSEQYYLGVWSAAGSANFIATLETAIITEPPAVVTIKEGTLDASKAVAPRWVRLDFNSLSTGEHTIKVDWDNAAADVRFKVKAANGADVSATILGTNPGTWTGTLQADNAYYLGLWNTNGVSNYTATIELSSD